MTVWSRTLASAARGAGADWGCFPQPRELIRTIDDGA
jgi:hypothetical protein